MKNFYTLLGAILFCSLFYETLYGQNVGIGTTSPTSKLDIAGDLRINNNDLYFRGGTDLNHGIGWYGTGKLWNGVNIDGPSLYGYGGGILGTNQNGTRTNTLYWNTQNVGIGTTAPTARLHVSGTVRLLGLSSGTQTTALMMDGSGNLSSRVLNIANWDAAHGWGNHAAAGYLTTEVDPTWDGTANFTSNITRTGNVGIGGTTADHKLRVEQNSTVPQVSVYNPVNSTGNIAGIRLHTASGWNVQFRTSQSTDWFQFTDAGGTVQHSINGNRFYPGSTSNNNANIGYITGNGTNVAISAGTTNARLYVFREGTTFGPGQSTIYARRDGQSGAANGGSGWGQSQVDAAIHGYSYWGNSYSAGVYGNNYGDYANSAGVLGYMQGTGIIGALAIKDNNGENYGLYTSERAYIDGGVIQRGGPKITNTSDLGLYSRVSGNWIRYVTNNAPHVWFTDDGAGSTQRMNLDAAGNLHLPTGHLRVGNVGTGSSTKKAKLVFVDGTYRSVNGTGSQSGCNGACQFTYNYPWNMGQLNIPPGASSVTVRAITYNTVGFREDGDENIGIKVLIGGSSLGWSSGSQWNLGGGGNHWYDWNFAATGLSATYSSNQTVQLRLEEQNETCWLCTNHPYHFYGIEVNIYYEYSSTPQQGTILAEGRIYANSTIEVGDLAEYFEVVEQVVAGDIVSLDPGKDNEYVLSREAYDPFVVGVISQNPSIVLNNPDVGPPVGLTGRVRVNLVDGMPLIKSGDFVTTSPVKGKGMKATRPGTVIGVAVENQKPGEKDVMILLQPGRYFYPTMSHEAQLQTGRKVEIKTEGE